MGELKSAYDSFNNENSLSEDEQTDEYRNVDPNLGPTTSKQTGLDKNVESG